MTAAEFAEQRMTYDEVAAVLGMQPQTIRLWVSRGMHGFPEPVRIGSRPYVLKAEFEKWLASRRKPRSRTPTGS